MSPETESSKSKSKPRKTHDPLRIPKVWSGAAKRLWSPKELIVLAGITLNQFEQMYNAGNVPLADFLHPYNPVDFDGLDAGNVDLETLKKRAWRLWRTDTRAITEWVDLVNRNRTVYGIAPFRVPEPWFARVPSNLLSLNVVATRAGLSGRSLYNAISYNKVPAPEYTYARRLLYVHTHNLNDWISAVYDTLGDSMRIARMPNPEDYGFQLPFKP